MSKLLALSFFCAALLLLAVVVVVAACVTLLPVAVGGPVSLGVLFLMFWRLIFIIAEEVIE